MTELRQDSKVRWAVMAAGMWSAALGACGSRETAMDVAKLQEFGTKYTAAWCSRNAASVAAFFSEGGSLNHRRGPGLHDSLP
jgi:hypothetical protein